MTRQKTSLSLSTLLVLALTAVIPLVIATGFANYERPRHLALVGLASLGLASWGVDVLRGKGPKIASPGTLAMGGAFVALVAASLAWSGLWRFGMLSAVTWLSLGAVFLILVAPAGRRPEFLDWTTAVAAGVIGAGGMGVYDFFGGEGLWPVWETTGVTGGFDAMAFAAAYYVVAIPLLVGAVALSEGIRRWFMALALLLGTVHLGLVVDPLMLVVWVGAMVAAGAVAWRMGSVAVSDNRVHFAALASLLVVATCGVGYALLGEPVVEEVGDDQTRVVGFERPACETFAADLPRVESSADCDNEMADLDYVPWWMFAPDRMEAPVDYRYRSYLNSVTRGLWSQEPLVGHGAGGWQLQQTDVVDDSDAVVGRIFDRYPVFSSPHSDYARISVEQGGLGLVLFVLWLIGIATAIAGGWQGIGTREDGDERTEASIEMWALTAAVLTGLALMAFAPVLETASSAVVWMGAAAVAVGHASRHRRNGRWLQVYDAGGSSLGVRAGVALVAFAVSVAMIIPTAQHGQAALERGQADHLMYQGNMDAFEKAIPKYQKAHETYPAHPEVLYNVAVAHHMLGQTDEGREAIEEALKMRPYDARLLTQGSRLALRTGRTDTALEHGREAVRTGPTYLSAYEAYAAALQRRARHRDAADLFKEVLDRNPPIDQRGTFRVRYANVLGEYLDEPKKAKEQYETALDELPAGPERMLIHDHIEELSARIERERLEEEGKPIPPELHPDVFEHDHDHGHDPHHGPGDGFDFDETPLEHLELH